MTANQALGPPGENIFSKSGVISKWVAVSDSTCQPSAKDVSISGAKCGAVRPCQARRR